MKGSWKSNTVDKYLRSIRQQMVDLVKPDTTVVDIGCGNGDLLFQLADKIASGTGLDYSQSLIEYARQRKHVEQINNLHFRQADLREELTIDQVDYALASLVFHVLPREVAQNVLQQMVHRATTTLVCAFSEPQSRKQQFLLWLDQRFSGHFSHFKEYQKRGGMEQLIGTLEGITCTVHDTFDPVIKVYQITQRPILP
jgi:ubiquinone/menaquinone biosynthesis C-methylase UbiE